MNEDKPKLELTGQDGNAFFIMGRAIRVARDAGWTEQEIKEFRDKAMDGDYYHLLRICEEYFDVG